MGAMFFLIAVSLAVALLFLGAFFWAVRSGQFEDLDTPAIRAIQPDSPISSSISPSLKD